MHEHLSIAVWPKPSTPAPLKSIETAIIVRWTPPLNLDSNPAPAAGLKAARARMADEARRWPG